MKIGGFFFGAVNNLVSHYPKTATVGAHMPPTPEPQNPTLAPVAPVAPAPISKTSGPVIKAVRIFLLILILIGVALIATEKLWVSKLVNVLVPPSTVATFITFPVINGGYSKNETTVWFENKVVQGADAPTFKAQDLYGVDARHAYFEGSVIPDADPKTYDIYNAALGYSRDAFHVFDGTTTIPNANPNTYVPQGCIAGEPGC